MRIATYNIKVDAGTNSITVQESLKQLPDPVIAPKYLGIKSQQPWSVRRLRIAQRLINEGIVLAGFQEALIGQVMDLAELLGPKWSWIGVGRDDGRESGESCPIFYRTDAMTLNSYDHFWLSETPYVVSKYPGAGYNRICTAAHFSIPEGEVTKNFTLINCQLDDGSDGQRRFAASLMLLRLRYEAVRTNGPVFVIGDFNSVSSESESTQWGPNAYKTMIGKQDPIPLTSVDANFIKKYTVNKDKLPNFKMIEMRGATPRQNVSANYATYTGFTEPNKTDEWLRIDFVFGGDNGGWEANTYKVDSVLADDGVLESDHRPVFVDITLL